MGESSDESSADAGGQGHGIGAAMVKLGEEGRGGEGEERAAVTCSVVADARQRLELLRSARQLPAVLAHHDLRGRWGMDGESAGRGGK